MDCIQFGLLPVYSITVNTVEYNIKSISRKLSCKNETKGRNRVSVQLCKILARSCLQSFAAFLKIHCVLLPIAWCAWCIVGYLCLLSSKLGPQILPAVATCKNNILMWFAWVFLWALAENYSNIMEDFSKNRYFIGEAMIIQYNVNFMLCCYHMLCLISLCTEAFCPLLWPLICSSSKETARHKKKKWGRLIQGVGEWGRGRRAKQSTRRSKNKTRRQKERASRGKGTIGVCVSPSRD